MNKQQGSAHALLVIGLVVALIAALGYIFWNNFIKNESSSVALNGSSKSSSKKSVTFEKTIVLSDGLTVKTYTPSSNQTAEIYTATSDETKLFCGDAGCSTRNVAITRDNSLIALDSMVKDGQPAVGIYDRTTKKATVVTTGERPAWSEDGKQLAVSDKSGIKIINVASRDVKTLNNPAAYDDRNGGIYNATLYGWIGSDEVIYDAFNMIDDASLMIGNTTSLASKKITVGGLADENSIRAVEVSQDGKLLLLGVDNDPGYNVGTASVGGADYRIVTANQRTPWPGSGYSVGGLSPDKSKVVVVNGFIPSTAGSGYRSTGLYQVHSNDGKHLYTVTDHRAVERTGICWVKNDVFYGLYLSANTDSDSSAQLGRYDISQDKFELVDAKVSNGYGNSIRCGE